VFPRPSRSPDKIEAAGVIIAALLSPLWFFNLLGLNISIADVILLLVWVLFVFRTEMFVYYLTRKARAAVFVFLTVVTLSIVWSTNRPETLLDISQYLFIFLVVVPIYSYFSRDEHVRWWTFVAVWVTTNSLALLAIWYGVIDDAYHLLSVSLWYGNRNQLFWLVAVGTVCNMGIALETEFASRLRAGVAALAVIEAGLIVAAQVFSAVLIVVAGVWVFTMRLARQRSEPFGNAFAASTVLAVSILFAVTATYPDSVSSSLQPRITLYATAFAQILQYFPLGMGIGANPTSSHNVVLAYASEVGIVGATAFLVLVGVWCRHVLIETLVRRPQVNAFEHAIIAIFAGYLLVLVFQPEPVRRFWWILFGVSWGIIPDSLEVLPADDPS
jgi:hypothetical protein